MDVDFQADAPTPEATDEEAATSYAKTSPDLWSAIGSQAGSTIRSLQNAFERGGFADASGFDRTFSGMAAGAFGEAGEAIPDEILAPKKEPLLPADQVNKQFGPQGPDGASVKITDRPMSAGLAQLIGKQKTDEIDREGVWDRYTSNHGPITNFAAGTAGFILDPLNAGSMFIPGVGEEAVLSGFGRVGLATSGIAARTAARAAAGAASGAAQMAPIVALQYGLGAEEASDYDLRSAAKDLAFSAAFGAAMHTGLGGLREAGILRPDELMKGHGAIDMASGDTLRDQPPSVPQADVNAIEGASLAQREAAMKASAAQLVDGRQIDVTSIIAPERPAPSQGRVAVPEGISPDLARRARVLASDGADVTPDHALEEAAIRRAPKEIQDALFSEPPQAGGRNAADDGRGAGPLPGEAVGPAGSSERLSYPGSAGAPAAGEPSAPASRVFYGSRSLAVRHELVDAASLRTSHTADFGVNPDFPAELQPRDRSAVPARAQVNAIAANLQPERLGPSPEANSGAPIVGPDNVVESGNGRTMAIRQAYAAAGDRAAAYRAHLQALGYDTTGFREPVLVARRMTDLTPEERVEFAHSTASSEAQRLGVRETAFSDARTITPDVSQHLQPGDVASVANRDFVKAFVAKLPSGEAAGMLTGDGSLSAAGVSRLRAALSARAYGDEAVIGRAFESRDSNIKNIGAALTESASDWIKMREAVERGDISPADDVTPAVMRTVQTIMRARDDGERMSDAFRQTDMFSDPLPRLVTRFFFKGDDFKRFFSASAIGDNLSIYARDLVEGQAKGRDMFGAPAPSAGDVLGGLVDRNRARAATLGEDAPPLTASDLARQQAQIARNGTAPGIPQVEFDQASDRLYGPKPDDGAGPKPEPAATRTDPATGAVVDPEMRKLEGRVLSAPALTDLDREAIAEANRGIEGATLRGQAYGLAGEMLARGETLPEDALAPAVRRTRTSDFGGAARDIVAYHGTDSETPFDDFDLDRGGRRSGYAGTMGETGTAFFTTDPSVADIYSRMDGSSNPEGKAPRVYKVNIDPSNSAIYDWPKMLTGPDAERYFDMARRSTMKELEEGYDPSMRSRPSVQAEIASKADFWVGRLREQAAAANAPRDAYAQMFSGPAAARYGAGLMYDPRNAPVPSVDFMGSGLITTMTRELAREQGKDVAIIRHMRDFGDEEGERPKDQIVVLDAKRIKSFWSAEEYKAVADQAAQDVQPMMRDGADTSPLADLASRQPNRITVDGSRMTARQIESALAKEHQDLARLTAYVEGRPLSDYDRQFFDGRGPEQAQRDIEFTNSEIQKFSDALGRFQQPDNLRKPFQPAKILDAGDKHVVSMATDERHGATDAERVFRVYDKPADGTPSRARDLGRPLGSIEVSKHPDGRWEVGFVQVDPRARNQGVATALYGAVQRELGIEMSPSGILLPDGYKFWQNRDPSKVQWHQPFTTEAGESYYLSPKRLGLIAEDAGHADAPAARAAHDALPPEAKTQAALDAMFRLREIEGASAAPASEARSVLTLRNPRTGEAVHAQAAASLADRLKAFDVTGVSGVDKLQQASHLVIGERLTRMIGDMPVYTVGPTEMRTLAEGRMKITPGFEPAGFYDPGAGHIVALDDAMRDPGEASRLMIHEGLHGAFMRTINESESARSLIDEIRTTAAAAHIAGGGDAGEHYGLINPHEFVSEAFSNPEFQRFLGGIEAPRPLVEALGLDQPGLVRSMWDVLVGAVRKILGFAPDQHTLLDAAMRLGDVLENARVGAAADEQGALLGSMRQAGGDISRIERAVAARGRLGPGEARTLIREVSDRAEQMRQTGEADPYVAAARELADKIQDNARKDKMDALRNAEARTKIMARIDAAGGMASAPEQLRSMLHGTYRSGLDSVQAQSRGLASTWQAALSHKLHALGLEKAAISGAMDEDIAKDLWALNGGGEGSGNKLARQAAEAIRPVLEEIKNRLNGLGARIGDATDYVSTTRHDPYKMRRAAGSGRNTPDEAFVAWWKDTQPLLAEKTFADLVPRAGETLQQARDRFGRSVFDGLVSGIHMTPDGISGVKFDPNGGGVSSGPAFEGSRNIAKKVSQDRTLFWKDGAAWNSYVQRYGLQTSLIDGVMRTANQGARQIALMERFGTNPMANLAQIERAIAERDRGDFEGVKSFQGKMNGVRNVMAYLDGSANIPANADWAAIGNNIRTYYSIADLGGVGVTHFASIWPTVSSEMRHHGMSRLETLGNIVEALVKRKGDAERQAIMSDLGAYADGLTRDASANWQPDSPKMGRMSAMANTFMKYTGIHYVFDNTQAAVRSMLSHNLARNLVNDFGALEPHLQNMLSSYGIGESEWNLLRGVTGLKSENGRTYLTPRDAMRVDPAAVEAHLRDQGALDPQASLDLPGDAAQQATADATSKFAQSLADKLGSYFSDVAAHSTVTAGARERAMLLGGSRAGTLGGEVMRFITQFKMWPVAAYDQLLRREIQMSTSKADAAWGIGSMMALSAASGYLRMTVNDVALGHPVRNPLEWQTALAGLAQGGGLGILGDFLFGEVNRMGGGLIDVAGGPVVSDIDSLIQIYNRFRRDLTDPNSHHKNGTFADLWPDLAHFAVRHIPFANLVYLKGTLDYMMFYHLYEAASPGWWDRTNRRIQKEQGRTMTGYTPGGGVPIGIPGVYLQNRAGQTFGLLGGFGAH